MIAAGTIITLAAIDQLTSGKPATISWVRGRQRAWLLKQQAGAA